MYYPTQDYNNQKYGLTFPKGNYEIYVNGEKISTEVEIKGAQTTMKEIDLTPPSSCTTPTNGMSISQNTILCSGNYSLPNGIVITSNNVILDCNGAKIIGSGSSNGITTKYNGASGITIKNCNINSFDKGIIILSQNSYMTIENNNLQSNNYGVYIDAYATYNSIIKNQFNNNVHDIEIGYESNHNTISQNLLNGSTFSPIRISEADFITIQDNNIYPKSNGIYIGRSNYNTLTNNQIVIQLPTVNSDGIWFFSSEENNILNNYVKGWKGGGIRGDFLNKSLIANNTVDSNKYYGLELSDSNNNRVVTNNLIKNGWYGLSLSGSSNNLIYSNKFDLTGINQNVEGNDFCFEGVCNICINGATGINCSCSPNWVLSESWGMCNISDYQSKEWIDTNGCNDNSNKPPAELLSCDFCNYTLAYTNWSNWKNQTECSNNVIIQNRSRALYDSNYPNCFAVTQNPTDFWNNKTEWEFNNLTCTSICNPNLINTSWSNWQNLSCIKNDKMNQSRYLIQYDSNNCGIIQNKTIYEYNQNLLCDFCRPNMINTTISDWKNQTTCLLGDYYIQNKSKTEYDSNFSSCYLITNLSSDLWNNGMNKTYWEFRNQTCDFCVLNLVNTSWSEWSNLGICTIKDIQNQSRFSVQYDSKQCSDHNIQNQTIIDYKTTSCDYCNYSVKTISTEWQNDSCLITDIMKQKRTNVTYDSNYSSCYSITHLQNDLWNNGQNITIQEFKELGQNSCNYCSEDISQPQFTQWSQCSNGIKNRVKYYIDSNYASCCAITNVDSDCSIKGSIYQNVTETSTDGCTTPPNVTANSLLLVNPVEGIYSERSIMFNLSSQDKFTKLIYTDNGGRESSLCTNCNKYTQKKSLSDGNHVLLFRGILPNGKNVTNQTELFVDSKDPQISTIKPQSRRYTNGSDFYIKYTEDNCRLLNLTVKRNQSIIVNSGNCSNGRNVEKFISQDISSFDGQEVEYQFIITDVAGNRDESRLTRIRVDTTAPQIIQFTNWTIGNYEYFNMTINELNFNKVEYYDNTESRPSWRSMCTSLKNGNCYKKVYFRDGNHNLNIRITDDAGNAVFRNVAFTAI
ncbi:MAG: right-handed parallel beta-helix repeat-containing protein [Candidatus Pacearchaeota archaeon]|nr:right-handed parallel beta-helix repeat-containing protein [Candidatus Pacearchaeota archaeon]